MNEIIDIAKLNKAEVLAALYNNSKPQGLGFLHHTTGCMKIEEAQAFLDSGQSYFDYLQGRVMKIDLSGDYLETWLYDRDNGQGAAVEALKGIIAP